MTTDKQDTDFQDFIVRSHPTKALEPAIEWIRNNLTPEDIFSEKELERWALANDFKKD
jgi:hypothetical protein